MEDKVNSAIADEKFNVPISRKLLQGITCRDVLEIDAGLEESVNNILKIHLYEKEERENKYGDPAGGYRWGGNLFLPNGTQLRMVHKKKVHYATVKFGKIIYKHVSLSPSEMAKMIANGTGRDAWKCMFIQLHGSYVWELAHDIRWDKTYSTFFRRSERRMEQKQ